jgi:hypothetical protein
MSFSLHDMFSLLRRKKWIEKFVLLNALLQLASSDFKVYCNALEISFFLQKSNFFILSQLLELHYASGVSSHVTLFLSSLYLFYNFRFLMTVDISLLGLN